MLLFTTRIWRMGRVLFLQVCVCPHPQMGIPHLHPIILPPVPCHFYWVSQWPVPGPLQGVPQSRWGGGTPVPGEGYPSPWWGTLVPGKGYPVPGGVSPDGVPPGHRQEIVPHAKTGPGYPIPQRGQDWGTPLKQKCKSSSGQYASCIHILYQFGFYCGIWNLLDHQTISLWNVILLHLVISNFCT